MAPRLELFPFRFRDPRTGKWVRVRYVAERHEIAARYAEWKITGPAETRDVDPDGQYFAPHLREGASGVGNLGPVLTIAGWKPTRHVPVAGVAMQGRAIDADLSRIKAALAGIADAELRGLAEATNDVEQVAPGLLAWLEAACDWELNRRQGIDYEMQPPEAAVPPEEDDISVGAAIAIRDTFAQDSPAVRALFDALVQLLAGGRQKH